nr:MAG TPA_asm: hypothetical protein [Caudoviricetes sp.]
MYVLVVYAPVATIRRRTGFCVVFVNYIRPAITPAFKLLHPVDRH